MRQRRLAILARRVDRCSLHQHEAVKLELCQAASLFRALAAGMFCGQHSRGLLHASLLLLCGALRAQLSQRSRWSILLTLIAYTICRSSRSARRSFWRSGTA